MQVNDDNLKMMRDVIMACLNPNNDIRRQAEAHILAIEVQAGFPLLLLALIQRLNSGQVSILYS
jgi:hypothetical protein